MYQSIKSTPTHLVYLMPKNFLEDPWRLRQIFPGIEMNNGSSLNLANQIVLVDHETEQSEWLEVKL